MALTATAPSETFLVVRCRLSMDKPTLITPPPCRDNIVYKVHSKVEVHHLTNLCVKNLSRSEQTSLRQLFVWGHTCTRTEVYTFYDDKAQNGCCIYWTTRLSQFVRVQACWDVRCSIDIRKEGESITVIFRNGYKSLPFNCYFSIWHGYRLSWHQISDSLGDSQHHRRIRARNWKMWPRWQVISCRVIQRKTRKTTIISVKEHASNVGMCVISNIGVVNCLCLHPW